MSYKMKRNEDVKIYKIIIDESGVHIQTIDAKYKSMQGFWIDNNDAAHFIPFDDVYRTFDYENKNSIRYKHTVSKEREHAYVAYSWIEPNEEIINDFIAKIENDMNVQMNDVERTLTAAKAKYDSLSAQKAAWEKFYTMKDEIASESDLEME